VRSAVELPGIVDDVVVTKIQLEIFKDELDYQPLRERGALKNEASFYLVWNYPPHKFGNSDYRD
jgi:hypothetical protein